MATKVRPKVNVYAVLERAVSEGISYGLHRHQKYAVKPLAADTRLSIEHQVRDAVMNALCEVVDFDD